MAGMIRLFAVPLRPIKGLAHGEESPAALRIEKGRFAFD
jgi:hypothetical protein